SPPSVKVPFRRQQREQTFQSWWDRVRGPVSGYNCFGHVFASRRTSLVEPDVDAILAEDGFGRVNDGEEAVDDVVVYSDTCGPTHVARVVRVEMHNIVQNSASPIPFVVSKLDDVSGEYVHVIG